MKKKSFFISIISALVVSSGIFIYTVVASPVSDPIFDPVTMETCPFALIDNLEFPETSPDDEIISHTGFSFLYNEDHEQSSWVAYLLTSEKTVPESDRKDNFRPDPAVKTGTATNNDYKGSGYDRGHLAPCADMCWSVVAMNESFFYSNMSPQVPSFNRGIWAKLEARVRIWAKEYDSLYIVTGPVLRDGLPVIGKKNKVSVPEYYYKVVLNYTSKEIKGIGFIMPNEKSSQPLQDFAVTIDSVQKFTGINFFYQLSEDQEECAEKTLCIPCWVW
jgi:endonuclease G